MDQQVIKNKLYTPINILIVEDNDDDYLLICHALDDYGFNYHSSHARNKKDLSSIIDNESWDIVLVDYYVPTLTFVESIEIIRNHDDLLPVILISGQVGEEIMDDIVDMNIDDFVLNRNYSRLPLSIKRCIRNNEIKRSKHKTEHDYFELSKRFELAIKGIDAGIWDKQFLDNGQHKEWWSPRYYELLGYKYGEIEASHDNFIRLLHPDDVNVVNERLILALKDDVSFEIDYKLKLKSGKYNWFHAIANVERDDKGNPIRMTGSFQNINDKKIIEEKLKQSNEELRLIFDNVPLLIFYKDDKNNILRLNKPAADSMGLSVTEAEGANVYDHFPPEAAKKYHDDDIEVITTGKPKLGIIQRYIPNHGKHTWVKTDKFPYYDIKSGNQCVLVLSKDTTDEKIAGYALAVSEQDLLSTTRRLQLATNTAQVGVWEWDIKSDKLYWDDMMFELYGITNKNNPRETYQSWLRTLHPDDRNIAGKIIRSAFTELKEIDTEFRIITPSGQTRYIKAHAVITKSDGTPEKMIGINQDITELRNTIDELNLTSERFMVAAGLSSDLIYEWQLESNQLIWHGDVDDVLGYKPDEFPQTIDTWANAIHEEDKIDSEEIISTVIEKREKINTRYRIRKKNGEWATWVDRSSAIFDKNNNPTKIIGTCTDISERLKAESKIKESDERNRLLVENSPYCIHQIDLHGNLSSMNPAGLLMMGKADESEIIGMPYLSVVDDKDKDKVSKLLGLAYKGTPSEFTFTSANGGIYQSSLTPIKDNNGKITGLMGMTQDITDVYQLNKRFQQIFESSPNSQLIVDAHGRIKMANNHSTIVFGYPINELVGMSIEELMPEQFRDIHPKHRSDYFHTPKPRQMGRGKELHALRKDRTTVPVEIGLTQIDVDSQSLTLATITDITERKKSEEENLRLLQQLNQSQKMETVGQLTAGIAHDFNNILASVLGYTELSLERFTDEKDQKLKDYLSHVMTAGERGRDLIGKMLTFSRKSNYTIESIEPVRLVNDVISLVRPTLPDSINLNLYIQKTSAWIKSDATHLQQALVNLVINARDAIHKHGNIDIHIEQARIDKTVCGSCHQDFTGEYIIFSVHDNGHGITESTMSRLFEPFFTTKDVNKGTGMGLAMVHGIIHDSNGHILVDSTLNEGTTIKLVLPFAEPETQSSNNSTEKHSDDITGHILLVDDEKLITELHREMLTTKGFEVSCFNESKLALEAVKNNPSAYDLILTDQSMPNMTGSELAEQINKINPSIPVLIITGYNDISESNINASGNIKQVLFKPISNMELIEAAIKIIN